MDFPFYYLFVFIRDAAFAFVDDRFAAFLDFTAAFPAFLACTRLKCLHVFHSDLLQLLV